jgi:hypothetical protein
MPRKNVLDNFQNIVNGDMSQASITSVVTQIKYLDNIGIGLNWTGTPTGTFAVQVSADYQQSSQGVVTNVGKWTPLTLSPAIAASGSADNAYIDITQTSAPFIRVVYTKTGGTGTLNSYIVGKEV